MKIVAVAVMHDISRGRAIQTCMESGRKEFRSILNFKIYVRDILENEILSLTTNSLFKKKENNFLIHKNVSTCK